ncbi:hypothetical protein ACFL6I_21150 [candidate division KSB1 bacterium]
MKNWEAYFQTFDLIVILFLLIIIYLITDSIQSKHQENKPIFKYLKRGLIIKIIGAIAFCFIYLFYYKGGDTISYFEGGKAMVKLMRYEFKPFLSLMGGELSPENWSYFNINTGWPPEYIYGEKNNFIVCRLMVPILFFTFNRFVIAAMILSCISFIGIWKFLSMLDDLFPNFKRQIAISVLFIPSVIFWGSGIMKDTFALTANLWLVYNIYKIFIKKQKIFINIIIFIINIILLISIKPYIFLALLPASLLWLSISNIRQIKNKFFKYISAPVVLIAGFGLGYLILILLGDQLGEYSSMDKILLKATVTQQDLIREEAYGENYYNIGEFDATFGSIIQKVPMAIVAGLFRPFIWDATNPVMFFSGLENFLILLLTIYMFIRVGIIKIFIIIKEHPILLFSILFSLIFALSVGLTSANYGALVRYKIQAMPFYVSSILVILYIYNESKKPEPGNSIN